MHRFLEGFRDVLEALRMLFERIFSGCASAASERAQRAKRAERYSREKGDRTDQFENGHKADPPTRKAHRTGPKNAQESPKNRRRAASETNSMQKRWSARSAEAKQSDTDKNSGNSTFRRTSRMINTRDLRIRAFIAYDFQTSTRWRGNGSPSGGIRGWRISFEGVLELKTPLRCAQDAPRRTQDCWNA